MLQKLVEGASGLGLNLQEKQIRQFESYYLELVEWNKRFNLTSITDYEEVQVKHFLDSLTVLLAIRSQPGYPQLRIIDVGSGPGMPGVPLKIAVSELQITLLEATNKKAEFLRHVKETLHLADLEVVSARAEDLGRHPGQREQYDVVVARALANLSTLLELTLPLCKMDGIVVAQKQIEAEQEAENASAAAELLGARLSDAIKVDPSEFSPKRRLLVYKKIFPTPLKYPRRAGMPAKRPLS